MTQKLAKAVMTETGQARIKPELCNKYFQYFMKNTIQPFFSQFSEAQAK